MSFPGKSRCRGMARNVLPGLLLFWLASSCLSPQEPSEREPERLPPPPTLSLQEPGWQSLFVGQTLRGWEVTRFGGEGEVRVEDGRIVLQWGNDLTGITWAGDFPRVDYEVELEGMRLQGNDFFCGMTFPVKDSHCSLIVGGWAGTVVGLSSIDGLDASENETRRFFPLEDDRWYRIRVRVTEERIRAWIDEEQVVDLSTTGRRIGIRPEVRLSRPFGIASWRTTAALRNLRVRLLSSGRERPD